MNKAEKSLRWVVNQIPDFKPTTNEEKMLVAIKLYSEAGAEEINRLEAENAELKSSLTHANEECLKWHERAQNLLKDSGGSISGYEKKISDLQAENAALRERLDKAIEAPCEDGDIFYRFFDCPIEMKEDMACGFRKDKDGEIYVCSAYGGSWYNIKECEFSREAAEARLNELQGNNNNGN